MGVINMAHGEMIMLGAYAAYVCKQFFRASLPPGWIDAYLVVAVPVAFLFAGAVGVLFERSVIRFLYGRPLETLLAAWGVSLILQQAVRSIFGSPNKEVSNPGWMTGGFDPIGGFTVTWNRIVIILFCFIVLGVLALILNRTQLRAAYARGYAEPPDGFGHGHSHRAGRCLDLRARLGDCRDGRGSARPVGNVSPNLGTIYIVDSFLVVVFGGVGNLIGDFGRSAVARHRQQISRTRRRGDRRQDRHTGGDYPVHPAAASRTFRAEGPTREA